MRVRSAFFRERVVHVYYNLPADVDFSSLTSNIVEVLSNTFGVRDCCKYMHSVPF